MQNAIYEQETDAPAVNRDAHIRSCQEAVMARMSSPTAPTLTTTVMTGLVEDGLICTVEQGKLSAVMDLGTAMGGDARGPSPGFFAKAGLLGCIAIATKMAAARKGLTIRAIRPRLEVTSDDRAIFGIGSRSAAPLETRVTLTIDTDEDDQSVSALVAEVLEMDTWFLALRDAQQVDVTWNRPVYNDTDIGG